jgi:hypothetical protein
MAVLIMMTAALKLLESMTRHKQDACKASQYMSMGHTNSSMDTPAGVRLDFLNNFQRCKTLQVIRVRNMFRQHYIASPLHPIAIFLKLVVLSVLSIQASIISGIVPPDNLPFVRAHIFAGSH